MRSISRIAFIALLASVGWMPPHARAATQQELETKVQALADELDALKAELSQLKAQQQLAQQQSQAQPQPASTAAGAAGSAVVVAGAPGAQVNPGAAAAAQPQAGAGAAPPARSYISTAGGPSFFGYGELNYAHPTGDTAGATADVARFVLGIGYQFDEDTSFASELELEHAVSSADDPGEIEVEQAYIERRFNDHLFAKLGLFLMPTGLLNENHEPTRYYGVFRNYVETAIIPTTWREGGVELQGSTDSGLTLNVGVTTGFNLNKWDATSEEGRESPLGSIHQELAQASAGDLSGFLALNYTGVPGLKAGGSVFSGGASQGRPGVGNARVTLWEGHVRWTPAQWELSALYARGHISNTAGFNLLTVGSITPIPESFFGWYGEAAYRAIERGNWGLTPFLRYERFNTGSAYADIAMGLTPAGLPDSEVLTGGVNWTIAPGVVIKGDYLNFRHGSGANRFDVGLGYQF